MNRRKQQNKKNNDKLNSLKKSEEEKQLEDTLFGNTPSYLSKSVVTNESSTASSSSRITPSRDRNVEDDDESSDDKETFEDDLMGDKEDDLLFVIDKKPSSTLAESQAKLSATSNKRPGSAVWQDEDDEELQIDLQATNRLKKLKTSEGARSIVSGSQLSSLLQQRFESKKAAWAVPKPTSARGGDVAADDEDDEDEDVLDEEDLHLLTEAGGLLKSSGGRRDRYLPIAPETISVKRLMDANIGEYSSKRITAMDFHPTKTNLILVGSEDKNLRVFNVDDRANQKVFGITFKDLPILNAKFVGRHGEEILVTGRKPYFYVCEMTTGRVSQFQVPVQKRTQLKTLEKWTVSPNGAFVLFVGGEGSIHLFETASKQWVWDGRMHSSARSATFVDNDTFFTSGFDGEVFVWRIFGGKSEESEENDDDWQIDEELDDTDNHNINNNSSSSSNNKRKQRQHTANSELDERRDVLRLRTRSNVAIQRPALQVRCEQRIANEDGTSTLSLAAYLPPHIVSPSSLSTTRASQTLRQAQHHQQQQQQQRLRREQLFYCIPETEYLCVGSMSGVATIYQRSALTSQSTPLSSSSSSASSFVQSSTSSSSSSFSVMKSVMNLTTKVTSMAFHPSGQLLVIASDEKKDQLKLVHLPSGSVYMNWPRVLDLKKKQQSAQPQHRSSPLHVVTAIQFSADGQRLAIGNGRGRVLLYQLNHFSDYSQRSFDERKTLRKQQRAQTSVSASS